MKRGNKFIKKKRNILLIIGIIVALIIAGYLVYTSLKSPVETPEIEYESPEETSGELNNVVHLTREESEEIRSNLSSGTLVSYVENLDKSGCLELETKSLQDNCIDAIDLTQKALDSKDLGICNDYSYQIREYLRLICIKKVSGANQ